MGDLTVVAGRGDFVFNGGHNLQLCLFCCRKNERLLSTTMTIVSEDGRKSEGDGRLVMLCNTTDRNCAKYVVRANVGDDDKQNGNEEKKKPKRNML